MCVNEVLTNLSLEGCVTKTVVAKTEMLWSILRISPGPALGSEQGGSGGPQWPEGRGCP